MIRITMKHVRQAWRKAGRPGSLRQWLRSHRSALQGELVGKAKEIFR